MKPLIQGKDAVLAFLENETLRVTNEKPGVYSLYRDDGETLVLTVGGFSFIGTGTISLSGNLLKVVDGRVMKASKPS
jgi:hypothetical protein